ncbi:hypothetical protein [Kitasatospora purpeofusca]|uniref:hypothetical protein n=1 Tax=Kitasatospora purpeofusca TaxID=67352 RepID=UPI002252224C|nr:hypothetical protein [Kitasatospora purpeofusca]MCX4754290.1 hypothetical protein [Kitasatospora purpeofusca]WSR33722.1 hypothetical protein OG715_23740 [Kitasatospora purpeofusca]
MSTTADLVTAAVVFGPGAVLGACHLVSRRGDKSDSAAVRAVLAESAAERATRTAGPDTAPPDGGEGAPTPADGQNVPLATVLAFPEGRVRRAA